jgi:hypothetical protein
MREDFNIMVFPLLIPITGRLVVLSSGTIDPRIAQRIAWRILRQFNHRGQRRRQARE